MDSSIDALNVYLIHARSRAKFAAVMIPKISAQGVQGPEPSGGDGLLIWA